MSTENPYGKNGSGQKQQVSQARTGALHALQNYRLKSILPETINCDREDDSRLAERIFFGVLQNERFLDHCLSGFLQTSKTHPRVMDLLRMSAYQIMFLDRVPDSAAVNDAVMICRASRQSFACGMVNAVLRKISAEKTKLFQANLDPSVRYSHPDWLVLQMMQEHDEAFTRSWLEGNQSVPELCLQINTRLISLEAYLDLLHKKQVQPLSVREDFPSVRIPACRVDTLPGYREGLFYVQDDAARASIHCIGLQPGMRVLDACAAPGGKSMAAVLDGAEVLSCDINSSRLKRCRENYERLGFRIETRVMDAAEFCYEFEGEFDAVIADVPCSGTGVIRRHPEIRRRTYTEVRELLPLQRAILCNLSRYVRRGGILLYSTCSVLREEDEAQVNVFLETHPDFSAVPICSDGFDCSNGMLRSWTHQNGNDGFFAAKMVRKHD